jgi:predicted TIM-barrel fold metal-dependent hydrolase
MRTGMIDVHTHLHPPRLSAAIRRWFDERSSWRIVHPTEPRAVAGALRAAGVERFVFCSYAHKPGIAAELNAWLAQTSRDLDAYGLPLATVHLDDPDPLADLRGALDDGCIGLKIHEDVQQFAADDPRFDALYAELSERDGFALVHVGPIPWDRKTNHGPRRIATILARHPRLRLVVAHLGVPDTLEFFALARRFTNLFLDTTMALVSPDLLTTATGSDVEGAAGAVVYGSDYPNIPYPYAAARDALEALGLSPAALRAVLLDNAHRLSPKLTALKR